MMSRASDEESNKYGRREFIARLAEIVFSVLALACAIPLVGSAVAPAFKKRKERWVDVGPVAEIKPGEPFSVSATYQAADGWLLKTGRDEAYVVTHDKKSYFVLSNVCTHLKCRVRWEDARRAFFCPCHDGLFDIDGNVISGPPPRPLDRFPHKIEKGRMTIRVG
jgi:menaquinol-cytochrome c reductase iron-sulfur subunit